MRLKSLSRPLKEANVKAGDYNHNRVRQILKDNGLAVYYIEDEIDDVRIKGVLPAREALPGILNFIRRHKENIKNINGGIQYIKDLVFTDFSDNALDSLDWVGGDYAVMFYGSFPVESVVVGKDEYCVSAVKAEFDKYKFD